jgi:hypothetical protein
MNSGATAPDWGSVDLTVLPTITVAKGGTNLSSFAAGDILYATGATTLAKLVKGSAADVLTMNAGATAPEWAAAAAGGAWNFISSTALDAATITVTGLDSTYDKYQFVLSNVHCDTENSGGQFVYARAIQGGSPVAGGSYEYGATNMISNSTSIAAYYDTGTTSFAIAHNGTSLPTAEGLNITLDIYHPASTTTWLTAYWQKVGYNHDNRININIGGGQLKTTAATTGIQFLLAAGAFDGGNVRLYGLANS